MRPKVKDDEVPLHKGMVTEAPLKPFVKGKPEVNKAKTAAILV
jgi:hypothetical protein